jgi:hypothetical protein
MCFLKPYKPANVILWRRYIPPTPMAQKAPTKVMKALSVKRGGRFFGACHFMGHHCPKARSSKAAILWRPLKLPPKYIENF